MIFKIGDRVKVKPTGPYANSDAYSVAGWEGMIIASETLITEAYCYDFLVEFDGISTWWLNKNDIVSFPKPFLSGMTAVKTVLPTDAADRKKVPVGTGVLDYFPAALAEVAKVSYKGNEQHNPGQPLHWARHKSIDQSDTIIRHFLERGTIDPLDGMRHSAKLAWRALALLQLELEAEGAPIARGASYEEKK